MRIRSLGAWILVAFVFAGCHSAVNPAEEPDRFDKGIIHISCDESFRPVIDQEVAVYESEYPDTKIVVHYKSEADCLKDLSVDSIRMILVTRLLSGTEQKWVIDSVRINPEQSIVARDLIAVVVNRSSPDTFYSMKEIRDLLMGKSKKDLIPVFDGNRATSTVRFMLDSVLRGDSLSSKVAAASSSREVINYVARLPNAVGFVGYNWIGNQDDSAQVAELAKVRLAYLESTDSAGAYVRPGQYLIYTKSYPLVRDLVYILKEGHEGLGHGFARFLESNRGQLVFRRAYLMPALKPNYIRDVDLSEKINNR